MSNFWQTIGVLSILLVLATLAHADEAATALSTRSSRIVFQAAEDTGLSNILSNRRLDLEKRQGKPLTGHQWWLWGLGSFDYDRDGDVDLMVCIHGSTNGMILRNELEETGKLRFADATQELGVDGFVPSTDNYPLMWDFNGDGYLDVAGLFNDTTTSCLLNQGGKQFAKAGFSLHPINYPDEVRDLNDDGYVDISQVIRDKRIEFLYDAESKTFEKKESPFEPPAGLPASIGTEMEKVRGKQGNRFVKFKYFRADLNADGRADLIIRAFGSYSGDRLGWYLIAQEDGTYEDRTAAMGLPHEGAPLLFEDLDHDGDVDLLITSGEQAGLMLNDGAGRFSRKDGPLTDFVKQRCPYLHVAKRVDLDHDGDLDLAVSNRRYRRATVFENGGQGDFVPVLSVRGWDADPLVLRDINNDGLMDVIVGGAENKENIGVYLNATPNAGNYCQLHLRMEAPNPYAVGTRVEAYPAGTLGKKNRVPILSADAHVDGSPLHIGLGEAKSLDLRVQFPNGKSLQLNNVPAKPKLFVTPQGVSKSEPNIRSFNERSRSH